MVPHTGAILTPASAHQDDAVLLDVVALAGDVRGDDLAGREPDTGRLALARVGLLGPRDAHLNADAPHEGALLLGERGGHGVPGLLALSAALLRRHVRQETRSGVFGVIGVGGWRRTRRTWLMVAFWAGVVEKGRMTGRNAVCAGRTAAVGSAGRARGCRRACRIAGATSCRRSVPAMVARICQNPLGAWSSSGQGDDRAKKLEHTPVAACRGRAG